VISLGLEESFSIASSCVTFLGVSIESTFFLLDFGVSLLVSAFDTSSFFFSDFATSGLASVTSDGVLIFFCFFLDLGVIWSFLGVFS